MYSLPSSTSSDKLPLLCYFDDQLALPRLSHISEKTSVFNPSARSGEEQRQDVSAVASPGSSRPAKMPVGFKFVNIVDPSQAKNPRLMRGVRQHAMNHHLSQAGRSVSAGPRNQHESTSSVIDFDDHSSDNPSEMRLAKRQKKEPTSDPGSTEPLVLHPGGINYDQQSMAFNQLQTYSPRSIRLGPPNSATLIRQRENFNQLMMPLHGPIKYRGCDFDPFHSLPLALNSKVNVQRLKRNCVIFFGSEGLRKYWTPTALSDRLFFLSSLSIAAVHADVMYGDVGPRDTSATIALETDVVRLLLDRTKNPAAYTSDSTIAAVVHVACAGNYKANDSLLRAHYDYLRKMIEMRGGLQALEHSGDLASVIIMNALGSAIFRECQPHEMFSGAAAVYARKPHLEDPLFESPVFCPTSNFSALVKSDRCSGTLLQLLELMHHLIGLVTSKAESTAYASPYLLQKEDIRAQLLSFRPAETHGHGATGDFIYESCRIAAVILERALFQSVSFSAAVNGTVYTALLKRALRKTDTEHCWGDMTGVLSWVTLIGAAAAHYSPEREWLVGAATRVIITNSFEHGDAIIRTLNKLSEVQRICWFSD